MIIATTTAVIILKKLSLLINTKKLGMALQINLSQTQEDNLRQNRNQDSFQYKNKVK